MTFTAKTTWSRRLLATTAALACSTTLMISAVDAASAEDADPSGDFSTEASSTGLFGSSDLSGSSGPNDAPQVDDHDPFYDTDGVELGSPGDIINTQESDYSPAPHGLQQNLPKQVTKIMYTTTDMHGEPAPATGYVMEPTAQWLGKGPRPTVVIGRGTVGQGDKCAPSRNWPLDGNPDPIKSGRSVNLEALYDVAFAQNGVRVVVTDYIGMGTPGMHTYMNRLDQAHAMIDAGRAARNLVQDAGGEFGKVGFYGHSQGGGASTAAVEEAPNYGADLDVAGAYASAPPADLGAVQQKIENSDLVGAIGFTINGLVAHYPELQENLEEHLNEAGEEVLAGAAEMCTDEVTEAYGESKTSDWTKDGRSLTELLNEMPSAKAAMEDQRIGNDKPEAPVMIVSGKFDDKVEYQQAKDLAKTWSDKGATVVYKDDINPPLGDYNHFLQAVSGAPYGLDFLLARFNDLPIRGAGGDFGPTSSLRGSVDSSSEGYGTMGSQNAITGSLGSLGGGLGVPGNN